MRNICCYLSCAALAAASVACNRGTANTDKAALQSPISISGCIVESSGTYLLIPHSGRVPVGTSGRDQQRYRLIDEGHVGIDRFANREAQITGKVEQPRQEGAAPNATDEAAEAATRLPGIRVTHMTTGGECSSTAR